MKFLLIVLTIHLVVKIFGDKLKGQKEEARRPAEKVRHPAEFELR